MKFVSRYRGLQEARIVSFQGNRGTISSGVWGLQLACGRWWGQWGNRTPSRCEVTGIIWCVLRGIHPKIVLKYLKRHHVVNVIIVGVPAWHAPQGKPGGYWVSLVKELLWVVVGMEVATGTSLTRGVTFFTVFELFWQNSICSNLRQCSEVFFWRSRCILDLVNLIMVVHFLVLLGQDAHTWLYLSRWW